jgi:hypothetical protein
MNAYDDWLTASVDYFFGDEQPLTAEEREERQREEHERRHIDDQ